MIFEDVRFPWRIRVNRRYRFQRPRYRACQKFTRALSESSRVNRCSFSKDELVSDTNEVRVGLDEWFGRRINDPAKEGYYYFSRPTIQSFLTRRRIRRSSRTGLPECL